jgi:TrpR-related protein YerC/YecD
MAKFKKHLNKKEKENLFMEFAEGVASLRSIEEIAHFIKDLLSEPETTMLARRLQIAKLLYQNFTYDQIRKTLSVGFGTIAKVHTWMQVYGEGYRTVLERTKRKTEGMKDISPWHKLKRKYPAYFWPELLLNEIVKNSNKRQIARLRSVISQLQEKTVLSKQLEQTLKTIGY